jgi:MoaA/NifB/PqqE/SkfB family radical SAM enzyme
MKEKGCRFGHPPKGGAMLIWEITNLCNLACLHCCTNSSPRVSTSRELSDEHVRLAIADFPKVPVLEVMFSGGEPFLRANIVDFIERSKAVGADVYIASNGTMITPDVAQSLRRIGIKRIDISLDGDTPDIHNSVRVHATAFDRTISGIAACVASELPIRVSTMVTPKSAPRFREFVDLVVKLGVTNLVASCVQPSSGRAANYPELWLESSRMSEIQQDIGKVRASFSSQIKIDCRFVEDYSLGPTACLAGLQILHISPHGDVSPCSWLFKLNKDRFSLGNLRSLSLADCVANVPRVMGEYLHHSECVIPHAL